MKKVATLSIISGSFLQEAVTAAFNASNQYADTFEPHREFYKENEAADLEAIRNEERELAECMLLQQ